MIKLGSRGLLNRIKVFDRNLASLYSLDDHASLEIDSESFLRPFDYLPIQNLILNKRLSVRFINNYLNSVNYIRQMGFPTGNRPALCKRKGTGTYLPIAVIPAYNLDRDELDIEIQDLIDVYFELIMAVDHVQISKDFLSTILAEMIDNASDHSGASYILLCAQYFRKENQIEICLSDDGIGLLGSLSSIFNHITTDNEALKDVIQKQLSCRNPHSYYEPGQGIRTTREMLSSTDINGSFMIISGNAGYYINAHIEKYFNLNYSSWNGTIVNMVIKVPTHVDIYKYV